MPANFLLSPIVGGGYTPPMQPKQISQYIGSQPQATFTRFLPELGRPMSRFFGNRYGDVYNEYLAALQQQALGGRMPTMQFDRFLSSYPWMQKYYETPRAQRGFYPRISSPRTRFLNF